MATFYLDYENGNDSNDGSTWALAWKTITTGATAARIAPGDVIRIAKSPSPVSIGNATWEIGNKNVYLETLQTKAIDNCEIAWVATNGATVTRLSSGMKQGNYCVRVTCDSTPTTNELQAYYNITDDDYSTYQGITFWIKNSSSENNNHWKICLCSDDTGTTIVDEFLIPEITSTNLWIPMTIMKDGGGNLGSSIKSIALYSSSLAPTASSSITLDNIQAVTTNGLNLQSLISKTSQEQGGTEGWFGIKSINDYTITLDANAQTSSSIDNPGYCGISGTFPTYKRETIKTAIATTSETIVQSIGASGESGNNISFEGGYNTSTNEQDGETFFDGRNSYGYGLYCDNKSFVSINFISCVRYSNGMSFNQAFNFILDNVSSLNNNLNNGLLLESCGSYVIGDIIEVSMNSYVGINIFQSHNAEIGLLRRVTSNTEIGIYLYASHANTISSIYYIMGNLSYGFLFYASHNNLIELIQEITFNSNYALALNSSNKNTFKNITEISSEASQSIHLTNSIDNHIENTTFGESVNNIDNVYLVDCGGDNYFKNTVFNAYIVNDCIYANGRLMSHNHNGEDNHVVSLYGGYIYSDKTVRHTASGLSWKISPESEYYSSINPLNMPIAKVACSANNLVTIKAWMRRDNTGITGSLVCRGGQIAGVDEDVTSNITAAADTWEEVTITFTPTETGIVEIEAWAYGGTTYSVYVDDLTISQA